MDLSTNYLGLNLRNPIIAGASLLTYDAALVQKCADAGAGAVVLKSLFEEQIRSESSELDNSLIAEENWHSEVFAYMEAQIGMRYGTREYLQVLRDCKQSVAIPVIASINCTSSEWWQDFAREVEAAGADALELNISIMPQMLGVGTEEIEAQYEEIVRRTRESVSIPFAVKLAPYFTSLSQTVMRLRSAGANGFVLFNRLYRPTVDIHAMKIVVRDEERYSVPAELSVSLRWISLLSGRIAAHFAAATGVHTGEDVVRALLVGADAVQMVSSLAKNGLEQIERNLDYLQDWMQTHNHTELGSFRGMLSQARHSETLLFGRSQYIKGLVGVE